MEVDWLNGKFLTEVLGEKLDKIDVQECGGQGSNFCGCLYRVTVHLSEASTSLIVKTMPKNEEIKAIFEMIGNFDREVSVYSTALPKMYELYVNRTGFNVNFTPKFYKSPLTDVLVMEDLFPLGFKPADRVSQLDLEHSKIALKTLAKFHGMSIALYEEDSTFAERFSEHLYVIDNGEILKQFYGPNILAIAQQVEKWKGYERFAERLRSFADNVVDIAVKLSAPQPNGINVLTHGDFWINNLLYSYDDNGSVRDVRLLDFQLSRWASFALDIHYFLITSVQPSARECEDALLVEYWNNLVATLRSLGCSKTITLDDVHKEMKRAQRWALLGACSDLGNVLADAKDSVDLEQLRQDDALDQLQGVYGNERFREIFQTYLLEFERKGLL